MVFPTAPLHIMELAEKEYEPGLYHCTCTIPAALLNAGNYLVHIYLSRNTDGFAYVHAPDVVSFHVINDGTGQGNINLTADWPGVIRPLLAWTAEKTSGQLPK